MTEKDGEYCTICGGLVPLGDDIRQIIVDGKLVGINQLDFILGEVKKLNLSTDVEIKNEILKRASALNYIPSRKKDTYSESLLEEYKKL